MKTLSIYSTSKSHVVQCVPIDFQIGNERSSQNKKIFEVNMKFKGDLELESQQRHSLYFKIYAVLELLIETNDVSLIKHRISHLETIKKARGFNMKKLVYFLPNDAARQIMYAIKFNDIFANPIVEKDELFNYLIMLNNGEIGSE